MRTCRKCGLNQAAHKKGPATCRVCREQHSRHRHLLVKHGLSGDDYEAMRLSQGGCCAICAKPEREQKYALSVDHDHESGRVRGLLCVSCNTKIGVLDNWSLKQKAMEYLSSE